MELPLFPLSTVLYPGASIPLHIFEDRYRAMFASLLEGERRFGVVAVTRGRDVDPASAPRLPSTSPGGPPGDRPAWEPVGCVAEVRRVRHYPDGRLDVVARGAERFRVERVLQPSPYIVAEVAVLAEQIGRGARARAATARALFGRYLSTLLAIAGEDPPAVEVPEDPLAASYLVAAGLQVDLADKQRLLAATSVADRLQAEIRLLRRELALLERLQAAGPAPMAGPFSLN